MDNKKLPLFEISKKLLEPEKPKQVEKPAEENHGLVKKVIRKVTPKTLPPLKEGEFRISSSLFEDQVEVEYEEVYYNAKGEVVEPPKPEKAPKADEEEEEKHKKKDDGLIEINLISKAYGLCCRVSSSGALAPALEAAKAPSADMTHAVKIPPAMAGEMKQVLKNAIDYIDKQIQKNNSSKGMWTITLRNLTYASKRV